MTGIIARDGGYIVATNSLRSSSFTEYIRGYNFQDDYNKVYELKDQLETTDSGLLQYKIRRARTATITTRI